ncbi:WGxxGxxG family protein [Paenibacillus methanolicus]|uniref:MYXO-CTERM domain-containing protein n=1 Tax=Paenibacillus methanolicus TaxID=582686 RepID=A0A5S5CIM2_9BACL|nr:WGxxGxxG family protein [Paenibacillus methanolicus]TYP79562.1 MYXO-CTERM domain-containing protein [Paenibacillus methanolicus]
MMTRLKRIAGLTAVIPLLLQFTVWDGSTANAVVINATNDSSYRLHAPSDTSNGAGFGSTDQLGFSGSTPGYIVEQGTRPGNFRLLSTPAGNGNQPLAPQQRGLSGSTPGYIMNQRAMQTEGIRPFGGTLGGERANDFDWGWLGLLGLIGLAGARRRASSD